MEKNPSILRFGSLSVKVSSSLLLVCLKFETRWRRPPRRSTTILVAAMGVRQSWSGKITTEIKKRCRPRNLPRWDLLLGFPICICFPNSGCRWRSAVILSVQLTLVELNLPLLPLWREVQSKRFYKYFVAILDVSYVRWLWKKEKSWEVTATLNMVLGTDGEEKLLQRLEDLWLKALSRGRPRGEGNTDEERGLLCQWKNSFPFISGGVFFQRPFHESNRDLWYWIRDRRIFTIPEALRVRVFLWVSPSKELKPVFRPQYWNYFIVPQKIKTTSSSRIGDNFPYTFPPEGWSCGENFCHFQKQIKCWVTNKLVILCMAGIYIENPRLAWVNEILCAELRIVADSCWQI